MTGLGDKIRAISMMKEAFSHLESIETADTLSEKRRAEREWKKWKKEHSEAIDKIKEYIVNEVIRVAKEDAKFREGLISDLVGMRDNNTVRLYDDSDSERGETL